MILIKKKAYDCGIWKNLVAYKKNSNIVNMYVVWTVTGHFVELQTQMTKKIKINNTSK